jgi:hypothetical protein
MKSWSATYPIAFLLSVFLLTSPGAWAQNAPPRAKTWDMTLQLRDLQGKTYNFDGGSSATTSDTVGWGLGLAYHMSNHLSFGGDIQWSTVNFNGTVNPAAGNGNNSFSGRGSVYSNTIDLNATYFFLEGPITPFVIGTIGSTYIDSNIPDGPPQNVCWYYPWYGYYCGTTAPTKAATYFSYGAGLGLRADVSRQMFVAAQADWLQLQYGAGGNPQFMSWRFDLGFRF